MSNLTVALPEYHRVGVKPRGFQAFADMFDPRDFGPGPLGLWEIARIETQTRRVVSRLWVKNVVTDNGALALLKNTWNSSGAAVPVFNQIAITTNAASTTLTSALASGTAYTALSVVALPGPLASGTALTIGYGTGQTQTVITNVAATVGATSISVNSFTANAVYTIGTNVVPNPATSDNPSTLGDTVAYSGPLLANAFSYSGSGAGNRQAQMQYVFPASPGTAAGSYNEAWTINTSPVTAVGQTASHIIGIGTTIDATHNLTVTIIEKL
jgi:hypothetical protein